MIARAISATLLVWLSGCGSVQAPVREGCYRFDDGAPLFKVIGREAHFVTRSGVTSFHIGAWHERSQESVEIVPALVLPGLEAGNPDRGNAEPVPSIPYTAFAFDPRRNAFAIPVKAYGEQEVKLGAPC